ncbi:hypothetical protein BC826DRAFT_1112357 [Russula brevipes]|nr:hypothetical protein BC826DRAFT_1112357 [Russula brevipes]
MDMDKKVDSVFGAQPSSDESASDVPPPQPPGPGPEHGRHRYRWHRCCRFGHSLVVVLFGSRSPTSSATVSCRSLGALFTLTIFPGAPEGVLHASLIEGEGPPATIEVAPTVRCNPNAPQHANVAQAEATRDIRAYWHTKALALSDFIICTAKEEVAREDEMRAIERMGTQKASLDAPEREADWDEERSPRRATLPSSPIINRRHRYQAARVTLAVAITIKCVLEDSFTSTGPEFSDGQPSEKQQQSALSEDVPHAGAGSPGRTPTTRPPCKRGGA